MIRKWISLFTFFMPVLALAADESISFTPPSTDYSVIFLGNIFGIVDGVLHGTGSQIMGNMFGVFNAAVLALGGIVVMYTLVVGTMNTAHEGQMLGQKWSSIWIPVRATVGLAFLIPKASGYCMMQIFIMWVVLQGVGAADKIWNSALNYLNRGGAIMKAQMNMSSAMVPNNNNSAITQISTGAQVILSGQVCMQGLQKLLEARREALLQLAESDSGPCAKQNLQAANDDDLEYFCNNPVPDFIASVNAIEEENQNFTSACSKDYSSSSSSSSSQILPMPNFKEGTYKKLNKVCGYINWNEFNPNLSKNKTLTCSDIDTTRQSRAVAIQQMYSDLTPVAIEMVDNDPQITTTTGGNASDYFSDVAKNQFGIPLTDTGNTCPGPSKNCTNWGVDPSGNNQTLAFTGFEFQNSILDYNGIMLPALNLQKSDTKKANSMRKFIKGAEEQGWIMAGAYFFNLVYINDLVTVNNEIVDSSSGLGDSYFSVDSFSKDPFEKNTFLSTIFGHDSSSVVKLANLIDGENLSDGPVAVNITSTAKPVTNQLSSTTYGFITNGSLVHLPGQAGLKTPEFTMNFNIQPGQSLLGLPKKHFSCGRVKFIGCVGRALGNIFYNEIFRGIVNIAVGIVVSTFNLVLESMLYLPLTQLMITFNNGVQLLETTMVHPIIALAYMGSSFINTSVTVWVNLMSYSIIFGTAASYLNLTWLVMVFVFLMLPFLASWLGVMVAVGWIDAYYAPFIPYMIFTFGSISWLMAVIESMVAGPIVALGVSHPEGHDALGKAEQAIMILVNIFLRPSMMIIGYVAAISLSYVTVFILNSGFVYIMKFLLPHANYGEAFTNMGQLGKGPNAGFMFDTPYSNWSAIYASFFCLVTYTSLYLTVVQKSFTLIHVLPDKILRWIGSQGEAYGQEMAQWMEESKGQVKEAGQETGKAGMGVSGKAMEAAQTGISEIVKKGAGGSASVS